jgi:translational regulator
MVRFEDIGLEVVLENEADFLKICETLTRIGIASRNEKKLFQSCHLLHKRGKYKVVHFKELFALDQRETNFSQEDIHRRNIIAKFLENWNLLKLVTPLDDDNLVIDGTRLVVLSFLEKSQWELIPKYQIGKKK